MFYVRVDGTNQEVSLQEGGDYRWQTVDPTSGEVLNEVEDEVREILTELTKTLEEVKAVRELLLWVFVPRQKET